MKNLEKFGVETLSTQEMRETDGGIVPLLLLGAALLLAGCQSTIVIGENNNVNASNKADSTANGSGNGSGNGNGTGN